MTEVLKIGVLDDDASKISQIMHNFKIRNKAEKAKYLNYELKLFELSPENTDEEIIDILVDNQIDGVIIDYDLSSFGLRGQNNGVNLAQKIKSRFCEYPIFILTAYEDRLFGNELFDAYQIYNFCRYITEDEEVIEFHSRLIEQILKSRKQIEQWEKELIEILPKRGQSVDVDSRILELDHKIEKSLDGETALPFKLKEDLSSNKLVELLNKVDDILKED